MKTSLKLAVVAVVALSMAGLETELMAKGRGRSSSGFSQMRRSSGGSSFSQRRSSGPSLSQARRTPSSSFSRSRGSQQLQNFNRNNTVRRTGGFSTLKPTKPSFKPMSPRTLQPSKPRASFPRGGTKPSFPVATKPGKPSFGPRPSLKPNFPRLTKPGNKPGITRPGLKPNFPGVNKPGTKPFPPVTPKPFPPIKPKPFPPIKPKPFPPIVKPKPFPPIKPKPWPPIVKPLPPIVRPRPPICLPRPDWCHPRPPRCHWWYDLCPPIRHCQPVDCVVYTGTYVTADVQVAGEVIEARWYLGLKGTLLPNAGLGIDAVEAGSPAELAGLKPGMVITNINAVAIVDETSMPNAIAASGGVLKMTLLEKLGGAEGTATVQMVRLASQSF